jgi:crotonobetainyl-CoA:carnitine CoA-transferase CaiB-like acyl-CoA transferase
MDANATADGTPQRIGFPVVDYAVGQQAALAVLAALYRRDRPDAGARLQGEWLQVSMMGAALTLLAPVYAAPLVSDRDVPRSASTAFSGNPLSGTFALSDGHLAIVCNAPDQAKGLLQALRMAGVADTALDALAHAAAARDIVRTQALLAGALAGAGAAQWAQRLSAAGVPATVVQRARDAARHASTGWPQVTLPLPGGGRATRVPGIGFDSSEPLTPPLRPPVRRGADTRAVLAEAGLSEDDVEALLAAGHAAEPGG